MLALTLLLSLTAGPRTDGIWLPSKLASKAVAGTASELDLGMAVVFTATEVNVGYGMEDETRTWRSNDTGLEVRAGDEWRKLEWKPVRDGVVKTDLKQAGTLEELTFVSKTLAQLRRERTDKLKTALLQKVSGKWAAGTRMLELGAASLLDGKPVQVRAQLCNVRCEGKTALPCVEIGELGDSNLYLQQGKKLVEVRIEGACSEGDGAGVELVEGGTVYERR